MRGGPFQGTRGGRGQLKPGGARGRRRRVRLGSFRGRTLRPLSECPRLTSLFFFSRALVTGKRRRPRVTLGSFSLCPHSVARGSLPFHLKKPPPTDHRAYRLPARSPSLCCRHSKEGEAFSKGRKARSLSRARARVPVSPRLGRREGLGLSSRPCADSRHPLARSSTVGSILRASRRPSNIDLAEEKKETPKRVCFSPLRCL